MTGIGSAAALLLAVCFNWAGGAKLVAPAATRASFVALGVPAARVAARVVPLAELALGGAFLVAPRAAGWGALALLLAFSAVLARALARGVEVGCRCFGGARNTPLSPSHLVRNGGLIAAALAATRVPQVHVPPIEAVVVVSCVALLCTVVVGGIDLRRQLGAFWSVALAGEQR